MPKTNQNKILQSNIFIPRLAAVLTLVTVGLFIALTLFQEHEKIEQKEHERLAALAKVIDENFVFQLDGIYQALEGIRRELPIWEAENNHESANRHLKTLAEAMPGIRTFLITNRAGTISISNRQQVVGQNVRYREYFQAPLKGRNLSTMYISPPFKTILGNFVINVALMIPGAKGEFNGVVSAAFDPEYFATLMGSVLYSADMWAALAHDDGKQFLMVPTRPNMAGMDLAKPGSYFTRFKESGHSAAVLTGTAYATGENRMAALRTIRSGNVPMDKPLVVAVSREMSAVFTDWRREAAEKIALFGILVLTTSLSLFFYQKRQRKFEIISADYEATQSDNAERLKLATEAAGVGIWDFDLKNMCLTWDNAMFDIYGQNRDVFTPTYDSWLASIMPDEASDMEAAMQTTINEGRPFYETFRIRRGDGHLRTIRSMAKVHCNLEQMPGRVIGICEDITERQHVQFQLEDLNEVLKQRTEEAEQASRSKSRFLSMVAHEFRTPLALLTSSTDILERYGNRLSSAEYMQQHVHIHNASKQISLLIDSVLAYNRLESQTALINPVELNIGRFFQVLANEVSSAYSSGQTFTVSIAEECGTALLDEILLRRIVENLLTNAFRYTAATGSISIQTYREEQQLVVAVTDTGIGIPEECRMHIFEAFFRCSNVEASRGLGLGLSIVKDALSYMGGTITVESTQDKGTTMRVNIPIVDQPIEKEQQSCTQS